MTLQNLGSSFCMSSFLFYILSYTCLGLQGQDGHQFYGYRTFAMLSIVKRGCSICDVLLTSRNLWCAPALFCGLCPSRMSDVRQGWRLALFLEAPVSLCRFCLSKMRGGVADRFQGGLDYPNWLMSRRVTLSHSHKPDG